MIPRRYLVAGLILLCSVAGCSRRDAQPVAKRSAAEPGKPLIDVVYDAATFFSSGGLTFQPPPDISIETQKSVRTRQGKTIEEVEIKGTQQKGRSEAVILFRFPSSWLTVEKEKLAGLPTEMRALSDCSRKLIENEMGGSNRIESSCTISELMENGRPGIEIKDSHAEHIAMRMFSGS